MPSSKISFPINGGEFPADVAFTFTMNVQNMNLGNFVNAQAVRLIFGWFLENLSRWFHQNYFGAPQQVQNGIVTAVSYSINLQQSSTSY